MAVRMFVADLVVDQKTRAPVVILQDETGFTRLPIFIGLAEATAIAAVRQQVNFPRPMTHDLLKTVLDQLGGEVESIEVTSLQNNTFYATLHLRTEGGPLDIDCRPSDALALALRTESPVLVDEQVLRDAGVTDASQERLKDLLENLDPDAFGKYKQ